MVKSRLVTLLFANAFFLLLPCMPALTHAASPLSALAKSMAKGTFAKLETGLTSSFLYSYAAGTVLQYGGSAA